MNHMLPLLLCRHESSVKHVVIESKQDPVAGAIYNITPNGPVFNSLYELIQEAQQTPLIQNHIFNVQLTCSPPKVNSGAALGIHTTFSDTGTYQFILFLSSSRTAGHILASQRCKVTVASGTDPQKGTQRRRFLRLRHPIGIRSLHSSIQVS